MSLDTLRASRVPWPIPNSRGAMSCPLCGLSVRRFSGSPGERMGKLERHIDGAHARCKACGFVCRPHRLAHHRACHHKYPTAVIPGLEHVA